MCGKATIAAVQAAACPLRDRTKVLRVAVETLAQMRGDPRGRAVDAFLRTGGLHAAGIFAPDGRLLILREDVRTAQRGRQSDRARGPFARKIDPAKVLLLVSGRVAFEIVQKRWRPGSAPSGGGDFRADEPARSMLARSNGMTLVGFLREGRMNIYAGADRIIDSE